MSKTVVVGIDPGASGALCALFLSGNLVTSIEFIDFKSTKLLGYINFLNKMRTLRYPIAATGIESVNSMPGQGVKSVFSFGQRLGELEGMLQTLEVGYEMPRPLTWQKACGVKPKSGKKGVYETLSKIYPKAELLGPKGGINDGRCDALGIAHFLRGKYQ